MVRSLLATMYQIGFDFQALPSTFLPEQVRGGRCVGSPDQLLLFLSQVSRKVRDAFWFHPNAPVCDFNVGKLPSRELSLQAQGRFVGVGRECGDVDEPGNPGICPSVSDECAAVGMTD